MNVKRALIAPVLLPYFLRAMKVSTNPASNGETIYMMLNPKITKFHAKHRIAEPNPTKVAKIMATSAQRFSLRNFTNEAIVFISKLRLQLNYS